MRLFRSVFVGLTKNLYIQFIRYGFVAAISLAVDFSGLVLLKEYTGIHYLLSATISFVAGLLTNYFLSSLWVFESSKLSSKKREFILFALIGVIGLILTDILLWLFTDVFGLFYVLSKAIATILVYFWNFGARKRMLFN